MSSLQTWMETVEYRITEGSEYGWRCYGPDVYALDSWNGEQDGHSFTIIFDKQNQAVYEMQAHDYKNNRAYRWINPDWKLDHDAEACNRNIDARIAWDDLNYVDLETVEDYYEKSTAIINGEEYDTRVSVPLELDDDLLFDLMKMAHEHDVTLNQMVEIVLRQVIDQHAGVEFID